MYNLNSEFRKVVKINICLSSKLWHQRDMMVCLKPSTTDMRTFSRLLIICYYYRTMTSVHAALIRLNVSAQKINFWEVQLENAIKRAEFLDDFDAKQISKEKKATISELSNFERSVRAGARGSR